MDIPLPSALDTASRPTHRSTLFGPTMVLLFLQQPLLSLCTRVSGLFAGSRFLDRRTLQSPDLTRDKGFVIRRTATICRLPDP